MSYGNRQYLDEAPVSSGSPVRLTPSVGTATSGGSASGLVAVGVVTMLIGIWGAIVPFIGPTFGFSADGSRAWDMTAAHFWLAVLPGAAVFVAGLLMLLAAPRIVNGSGRSFVLLSGLLAVLAGAWFVVGPLSWAAVSATAAYFVSAPPLRELAFQIGYAFGPGMMVLVIGGFALGWSALTRSRSRTERAIVSGSVATPVVMNDDAEVVHEAPPVVTVTRPAYQQPM